MLEQIHNINIPFEYLLWLDGDAVDSVAMHPFPNAASYHHVVSAGLDHNMNTGNDC